MLAIARTLMGNPLLIMLDEPSEGLAPRIVAQLAATVVAMKEKGLTVLLAEQNLRFASGLVDRAYVIVRGRVAHEASASALLAEDATVHAGLAM
jgi:branched-chain amino acid transport system ATP-binding protein